jgi:tripartite-type tricarboxylate transporter receptor subunit TctC
MRRGRRQGDIGRLIGVAAVAIVFGGGVRPLLAQSYPAKPVRIVTVAPGSANDIVARLIAQEIRPALGQAVVVDNRGTIAAEIVARAPADGYTLLLYGSAVWLSPFIRSSTPYDLVRDFAPITLAGFAPLPR